MSARLLLNGGAILGEYAVNGTFDGDFGWTETPGTRWSIAAGVASVTDVAGITSFTQDIDVDGSKTYTIGFEMTAVSGGAVSLYMGDYNLGNLSSVTTLEDTGVTGFVGTTLELRASGGGTASVDNVYAYETSAGAPTGANLTAAFNVKHTGACIYGIGLSGDVALEVKCGDEWEPVAAAGTPVVLSSSSNLPLAIPTKGEYRVVAPSLAANERIYFDQ